MLCDLCQVGRSRSPQVLISVLHLHVDPQENTSIMLISVRCGAVNLALSTPPRSKLYQQRKGAESAFGQWRAAWCSTVGCPRAGSLGHHPWVECGKGLTLHQALTSFSPHSCHIACCVGILPRPYLWLSKTPNNC